jgi:magnesium-transporting ATPase (P-type)
MSRLPPSYEATQEDDWPEKPEWETLPVLFWRRGRGPLVAAGALGVVLFFVPWVHVQVPEVVTLSGFDIARTLGWVWACLVAWVTLVATAASRRSVAKMRGARVAAGLFCAIPLVTVVVLALTPPGGGLVPVRFTYAMGFYGTLAVAALGLSFALRFGGRLDDLPLTQGRSAGETLH